MFYSSTPRNIYGAAAAVAVLVLLVMFPASVSAQEGPALVGPGTSFPDPGGLTTLPGVSASADGRFVAFQSTASLPTVNLPGGFAPTSARNVYVRDMQTGNLTLASINSAGNAPGNSDSFDPMISENGRYVVFGSTATDLIAGSTLSGVFVHDVQARVNTLVASDGSSPFISANGRTIVYQRSNDIMAYDVETGARELVSASYTGGASNGRSELPILIQGEPGYRRLDRSRKILSDDGRFVVFTSVSTNLVIGTDSNCSADVFVRDLQTDTTTLVSIKRTGEETTIAGAGEAAISSDGRLVAFTSRGKDLAVGTPPGLYELFVRDLQARTTTVASARTAAPAPNPLNFVSSHPSFSRDGRYLAFQSTASDIVPNDNNHNSITGMDVFVRDLQTNTTTLASVNSAGTGTGDRGSLNPQISANGRFVAFESYATNLDAGVTKLFIRETVTPLDVYVRDLQAGATRQLSVDSSGTTGGDSFSYSPSITAAGEIVFFESIARNLVTKGERFVDKNGFIGEYFAALTAPSRLKFATSRYDVAENGGSVSVTVTRNGATDTASTADYTTQDGSARAGRDYTATSGTLTFAPGETSKTINIPILDNDIDQADDAFFVYLNNFNYAPLPTVLNTTLVVIADNDSCTFSLSPSVLPQFSATGEARVSVIVQRSLSDCPFTATSNSDFITNVAISGSTVTFSVASNPNAASRTGTLTIAGHTLTIRQSGTASGSAFELESSSYATLEGARNVELKVLRRGDTNGVASVRFRTIDDPAVVPCDPTATQPDGTPYPRGTAYGRCDYATTVETLTWAAGDSAPKTITIPLIDDAHAEGTETFRVSLSDPQGGEVGSIATATVTVSDNDTAAGQNPIRNHAFFVRQHYLDFLSREPETGEPWTAILNNCPDAFNTDANSASARCDRILVSSSFFLAPEFRLKGFYAYLFYRAGLNRRPEYSEIVVDMRDVTGQTPEEVFSKRAAFAAAFVQRAEFKALYDGLSNAGYVDALLGRYNAQQITTEDPQQPESTTQVTLTRQALTEALNGNTLTRAQVLRAVVQSDEAAAAEFHGAFVAMQYYGYLRRTPEQAGYDSWLRVIREDPNNIRTMINGFMNSTEYALRFGPR